MIFSTLFSHRYRVNWKQLTIIWCLLLVVGIAQAQTNLPLNTVWETSSLTSEDLIIPTNTTSLSIAIKGGDGGRVQFKGSICNDKKILGGEGAAISATFTVGDQSDMLKAGGTLRVITGQAGGVDQHGCIEGGNYSGGGGGSTAILYLPPGSTPTNSSLWHLLAVAGGGGGANRPTSGTTYKGKGANAEDSGDSVQSNIAKGGKNMGIGSAGTCPDFTGGIELGYSGGSGNCSDNGRTQNGRNMISGYSDEVDQDGKILSLRVGLEDLSIASGTGGTDGKADGGDGFTGGAAGAGGGGGGGGSSGGAGGLRTPGGGGGSWLTQGFQITESNKSSGGDGSGSGNNGFVQLTASLVPKSVCKSEVTINLDGSGSGQVSASDVDNGSLYPTGWKLQLFDNTSASIWANPKIFTCSDAGKDYMVQMQLLDASDSFQDKCFSVIKVQDNTAPITLCQNTYILDAKNTSASNLYSLGSLRWQSFTAQRTSSLTQIEILGRSNFTPMNTTLTIKVYPGEGTGGTPLFTTSKQMTISPTTSWIKLFSNADIPVQSGNRYTVSVQAAGGLIFWISSGFSNPYAAGRSNLNSLSDFGFRTYTIGATPIQLDAAGVLNLTLNHIDNGSTDACGIASRTLSQSSFDCSEVGEQTVTLTVTDNNGNSSSCNTILNVQDKTAPVALCQNTYILDAKNTSASNLSSLGSLRWQSFTAQRTGSLGQIEILGKSNFTPMNTTLTIKVYPGEGTGGTPLFTTSKQMTISPTTSWIKLFSDADIPVQSGNRYTVSVQAAGGLIFWLSSGFSNPYAAGRSNMNSLSDFGFRTYTIRATPVQLDAAGVVNITLDQIDNGSTDACGIASRTLSQSSLDCSDLGDQAVTLTVTDNSGNASSCQAVVRVEDNIAPVAKCNFSIVEYLDNNGQATTNKDKIDLGSYDNCGGELLFDISKTSFTCADDNTYITTTITDTQGNQSTCRTLVRIQDLLPPTGTCKDLTVQLDEQGAAIVPGSSLLTDLYDNYFACDDQIFAFFEENGRISTFNTTKSFDCSNIGINQTTVYFSDYPSNVNSCVSNITIVDNSSPVVNCESSISIELDATGSASISIDQIDNGASDACGIAERSLDITDFNCQDLGENTIVLTVKDINGNQSQCTTTVEVLDVTAPDVLADLVFVSGDASSANFEVDVAIDDVCDIDPTLVSVMEIPEVSALSVSYKVKNKKKVKISLEDNTVKVEAPDPVDFWQAIVAQGGIFVEDEQVIKLNKETAQVFHYQFDGDDLSKIIGPSFSLLVSGTDASGNTSTVTAIPDFPGSSSQSALTQSPNESSGSTNSVPVSQNMQSNPEYLGSLRSYPNPFSNFTNIEFKLSHSAKTSLQIFNLQGQRVFDWQFGRLEAGQYEEHWQGISSSGDKLPAGLYLIQLQTGADVVIEKVTLQR